VPVVHEVTPSKHGLGLVVQDWPAVQALHAPFKQTRFVPQPVPFCSGASGSSRQSSVPVVQDVFPPRHGSGLVVHATPALQMVHAPALHTWFVPHDVPFATSPVSTQTGAPVAHEMLPMLHTDGVQAAPCVQEMQLAEPPPLPVQTRFAPQLVPPGLGAPGLSTHTDVPVEQDVIPVRQGSGLPVHARPAVQPTHAPVLQTRLVPQDVPFTTSPVSTQTGAPLEHSVLPVLQTDGAQAAPCVQEMQPPDPLQTRFAPQLVPPGSGAAGLFTQTDWPVEQEVSPVRHASGLSVQARPAVQATQALW
jgi:hypothetical protein